MRLATWTCAWCRLPGVATLVEAGQFRQDLLYRLNAAELHLPPLRQRQDLAAMLDRLLADLGGYHLEEPARAALLAHRWPATCAS